MNNEQKDNNCDQNNNKSGNEDLVPKPETNSIGNCGENSSERPNQEFEQQVPFWAPNHSNNGMNGSIRQPLSECNLWGSGAADVAPTVPNQWWTNGYRSQWNESWKSSQPKRPILRNRWPTDQRAQLLHTSAPNGENLWYNTFANDSNRNYGFRPNSSGKHIHWDASTFRNRSSSPELLDSTPSVANTSDKPMNSFKENKSSLNGSEWRWTGLESNPSNTCNNSTSMAEALKGVIKRDTGYLFSELNNNFTSMCSNILFKNRDPIASIWANTCADTPFNLSSTSEPSDKVKELVASFRISSIKGVASYTWSGQLPRKVRTRNPIYSCKVFLGGIPYDLTDSDLHCTFAKFGHIQIQWPGKDIKSAIDGATANKAGYVYIIFESYDNVAALLNSSTVSYRDMETGCRWYYEISSRRQKAKEVQVIPFDIGDRFYMKTSFSGQMEHSRTVFVGALHGMLTADGLAKIMDDLFSGVIFAGLDTDKHKYPLGSGRVSFDNEDSYLKAVSAAFVDIKSNRFKKKIQIDPYIENESMCAVCRVQQQSPVFCRDDFQYFCHKCWDLHHSDPESAKHRPIIKNKPSCA